jgi:hypothetical protein
VRQRWKAWRVFWAIFQEVVAYLEMYNVDDRIHSATVALYVAILAVLEEVLVFYTKSSGTASFCSSVKSNHSLDAAKHSKVLVQGDQYTAPMEESIAQIQKCADDLVRDARRKFERILLQCWSTRATPIYAFSIAIDPLTRMALDTEKARETCSGY